MEIGKKNIRPAVITVTLNPALDRLYQLERLPRGADQRCAACFLSAGGKGINVSRTLGRWRVPNCATGFLGGRSGEMIKHLMDQERLRHDCVPIDGETRSNVTVFESTLRRTTRVLEPGPRVGAGDIPKMRRKIIHLATGGGYVVFSGQLPPGAPVDTYRHLVRDVQKEGMKAVLDTGGAALRQAIPAKPFLIKPNQREAEEALGRSLQEIPDMIKAVLHWRRAGVRQVILTMGSRGVLACDGRDILIAKLPRQPAVSTVGNGDALLGGFLAVQCRGGSFEEAVALGIACGAANTLNLKPGTFSRESALRLRRQVVIRKIQSR